VGGDGHDAIWSGFFALPNDHHATIVSQQQIEMRTGF
jgi:hypothetical protein